MTLELHGHRGARGRRPENTLPAFAYGLGQGMSALELDVGLSKDGQVVVVHDPYLNPDITRDHNARWLQLPTPRVRDLTFSELQSYDVGRIDPHSDYAESFAEQRAVDGATMPSLDELIDLINKANNHTIDLNVEIKVSPVEPLASASPEQITDAVLEVLERRSMLHRVIVQSFDWRVPLHVQRCKPSVATAYLTCRQPEENTVDAMAQARSPWLAGYSIEEFAGSVPKTVAATGGPIWAPYYRDLTSEDTQVAHEHNLKVIVWTVNDPADIVEMMTMGVDGIISDYPDSLRQLAGEHGFSLPTPTPVEL